MQNRSQSRKIYTLNIKGTLHQIDKPWVMGIINRTSDSFHAESRSQSIDDALIKAERMINDGAKIIEIGGQSTRPGAQLISQQVELDSVIPTIEVLANHFPQAILCIDTFYGIVAKEAMKAGAAIINDISAFSMDENMKSAISSCNVPYILMHMRGQPASMQINIKDSSSIRINDLIYFFSSKIEELRNAGVCDILIDPGFGFGKSLTDNYSILNQLNQLSLFDIPILVGLSRKKMIQTIIQQSTEMALNGTTAAHTIALMNGASILRAHDVVEACQAVDIFWSTYTSQEQD